MSNTAERVERKPERASALAEVGSLLRFSRVTFGEVAVMAGISIHALRSYMVGRRLPSEENAQKVVSALRTHAVSVISALDEWEKGENGPGAPIQIPPAAG